LNIENLTGSGFNDTLEGNSGNNALASAAGSSDTVSYEHATAGVTVSLAMSSAQNTIGAGTDTLTGFENLTGSGFNDVLTGSASANVLMGLGGNDTLNGGGGADTMIGGAGADTLTGGAGNDTFVFNATGDSSPAAPDVVTDFLHGTDKIDLSAIDANTSLGFDQPFAFGPPANGQNANVVANSVTWFESSENTFIKADVNGNTTADLTIVLTGVNHHVTASDFIL
jgi:Ca2+-binding RTX toxin-like protein